MIYVVQDRGKDLERADGIIRSSGEDMGRRGNDATDMIMATDATTTCNDGATTTTCNDGAAVEIPMTLWPDSFEVVGDDDHEQVQPDVKQVRIVEELQEGTKRVSKARISAAEKRRRKAKRKSERNQSGGDITTPDQLERARTAYEVFHKLHLSSSTDSQVKESSAGIV